MFEKSYLFKFIVVIKVKWPSICLRLFVFVCQHAHALQILSDHLREGSSALDVGSGSGYLTSCMAVMVSGFCLLVRQRFK